MNASSDLDIISTYTIHSDRFWEKGPIRADNNNITPELIKKVIKKCTQKAKLK